MAALYRYDLIGTFCIQSWVWHVVNGTSIDLLAIGCWYPCWCVLFWCLVLKYSTLPISVVQIILLNRRHSSLLIQRI
jgi:hypothetical protein